MLGYIWYSLVTYNFFWIAVLILIPISVKGFFCFLIAIYKVQTINIHKGNHGVSIIEVSIDEYCALLL